MTLARLDLIETALGVTFCEKALLMQAVTHRSWVNDHPQEPNAEHNERLEFLGDALLDFVVAEFLYERFPQFREGDLTLVRAALVRTEMLARFAERLGVARHLRLARGEEAQGGRTRPPILADTFEAMLGAVYLDQGLVAVRRVALQLIAPEIERMRQRGEKRDSKSVLQEWVQDERQVQPRYQLVEARGPDHAKTFVVAVFVVDEEWGRGEGSSKRLAEQNAAQNALEQRDPPRTEENHVTYSTPGT